MEFLRQLLQDARSAWGRLETSARVNVVLAGLVTVAAIVLMVSLGARTQYVTLFAGMTLEDAAAVRLYLEDQNIDFRLKSGGQTVQVPARNSTEVRVQLASQGLPTSQTFASLPGFEMFDQPGLTTNQWLQDVNYVRALQGALQRQLNEFDFIRKSFVYIRETQEELFSDEQTASEAAVTLDVTTTLSNTRIKAILHIISSFGGPKLGLDNITLTTTDGIALHMPAEDGFASIANSQLTLTAEIEQRRKRSVETALAALNRQYVVTLSTEVDFDTVREQLSEPVKGPAISEGERTSDITTTVSAPVGPPGLRSNLPGGAARAGATETSETLSDIITNYEHGMRVTERASPPGAVKRWLATVLIEGTHTQDADGETVYVPLTDTEKSNYRDLVLAAVGPEAALADIKIHDHPFDISPLSSTQAALVEMQYAKTRQQWVQWGMDAGRWTALALVLLTVFLWMRRLMRRTVVVSTDKALEEAGLKEIEEEEIELPEATIEDMRRAEVAGRIEEATAGSPEAVAALLRSWLHEGEE